MSWLNLYPTVAAFTLPLHWFCNQENDIVWPVLLKQLHDCYSLITFDKVVIVLLVLFIVFLQFQQDGRQFMNANYKVVDYIFTYNACLIVSNVLSITLFLIL